MREDSIEPERVDRATPGTERTPCVTEREILGRPVEVLVGTCTRGEIEAIERLSDGRQNVIVRVGDSQGWMPPEEQPAGMVYRVGNRIDVYVVVLREMQGNQRLVVSQAHPELVRAALSLYILAIDLGIVEVKAIARGAGYRSKVAVDAADPEIDHVDVCLGRRGMQRSWIEAELSNEKVELVRYSADPVAYITDALRPGRITAVVLSEDWAGGRRADVIVPDDQRDMVLGRGGQNVRLAAQLTGWDIRVRSESDPATGNLSNPPTRLGGG